MKKTGKLISLLLSIVMLVSLLPFGAIADGTATVTFSAQADGAFLLTRQELDVKDGLAEEYGYTVAQQDHNKVSVESPTVFDAFVAAHKAKYGELFTSETAKNYLEISSSGSVTKAFGIKSSDCGFFVNGTMLNDGKGTSYYADTARLGTGDNVDFWFYQSPDDYYWGDYYTYFTETEKTAYQNEPFNLKLMGFMAMSAMSVTPTAIPIDGTNEDSAITINRVNGDGSLGEALTGADGNTIAPDASGNVSLTFDKEGTYIITANGFAYDANMDMAMPIIAPYCKVTVLPPRPAPTELNVVCENALNPEGSVLIAKTGDILKLKATDQDGNETPVRWSTSSGWLGKLDAEAGTFELTNSLSGGSGTSYLYINAVSVIDASVKKEVKFELKGYTFPENAKNKSVTLSEDGQTAKTADLTGGYDGHTIWSYDIPDGIAKLSDGQNPDAKKTSIKFDVLRPGKFTVSLKLDLDETLTDSATVTVKGVAVEDAQGVRGKTYLTKTKADPAPSLQLNAYTEEGRTVSAWSSSDESVAKVDENGLVTAIEVGSAIITATDSEGTKGGIKVVVQDGETPYFENLQFLANAIKDYSTSYVFSPTKTEYNLQIKQYSTSTLTTQTTTVFDEEKFNAAASYTDANGVKQNIKINNGKTTALPNIAFDDSVIEITLSDKSNPENKTVYKFNVNRPRDTSKALAATSYSDPVGGIEIIPDGRNLLSSTLYMTKAEGTLFKINADESFVMSGSNYNTGITSTHYNYKVFLLDGLENFLVGLKSSTNYAHIRYSTDDGKTWTELPQGGGSTGKLGFENKKAKLTVQVLDDAAYSQNIKAQKGGFDEGEPAVYTLYAEQADAKSTDAQILTASSDGGDWYPEFNKDYYSYAIVVPNGTKTGVLKYTAAEGSSVMLNKVQQTADENGVYTLNLKTSAQTLSVTAADGSVSSSYSFTLIEKSKFDVPDKVVDFLCIGSQYTNGVGFGNGASPWMPLKGTLTSLGNFGGYITFYYEKPLTDDPKNKYGVDFYVYGNANSDGGSFGEPGQVYVSEDGNEWYALAGSEHYEDKAIWDYTITYTKTKDGKSSWTDNQGNSMIPAAAVSWPSPSRYFMNDYAKGDSYTYSGILLKSQEDNTVMGTSQTSSFGAETKFGYADYYANGTIGAEVNPYMENPTKSNGFDLAWAVDANGDPIDVSEKEFHYVKIATASNIWAGAFKEKSTEISSVIRTAAQSSAVGKTDMPSGITISDGADKKVINFADGQTVYNADLGDMKYVSVSVNGAKDGDNIYVNNERISADGKAEGLKVTKEDGEKLVRIIVQSGEKEPYIALIKLKSNAEKTNDLIEKIKVTVSGASRTAVTRDGKLYTDSVGYRIDSAGIVPITESGAEVTINGEAVKDSYALTTGENIFEITAKKDGITQTVTLKITKSAAPASTGKIKVFFTLLGDDDHGDNGDVHTLKKGGLKTWIKRTAIEVESPATVLDVFESALKDKYSFKNSGGNYISEIDGLAEFSNGLNSGWMYTLNGTHPENGVAEQVVSNGDVIVFHYTDDYNLEEGSEHWGGGSSGGKTEPKTDDKTGEDGTKQPESQTKYVFSDVKAGDWYYEAVKFAAEKNLLKGISDTEFAPMQKLTRAMLVTILYRLENEPAAAASKFSDVSTAEWYAKAVAWANENGIVNGVSDTEFAPLGNITREQIAAILFRYAKYKKLDVSVKDDTNILSYEDFKDISEFASEALQWAVGAGLINGKSESTVNPLDFASRAEIAVILMRFISTVKS